MTTYLADTNIFLRFFLKDNETFYKKAKNYLTKAKNKKIKLIVLPEIIFEIDYVLQGVYKLAKQKRAQLLKVLVETPYLIIESRDVLMATINQYQKVNIDLFDIFLYQTAQVKKAKILSFDKDFRKLKRIS